jgi:Tol biopolymer transport system component/acetyl esterase/lipase
MLRKFVCTGLIVVGLSMPGCRKNHAPHFSLSSAWYADFNSVPLPVRISPDGRSLLINDQRNPTAQVLRVVNVDTLQTEHTLAIRQGCLRFLWNPDGNRLSFFCFAGDSRELYLWDLSRGLLNKISVPPTTAESWLQWSPNGRYLAYHSQITAFDSPSEYMLVDSKTQSAVPLPFPPSVSLLSWSGDSRHLALVDDTRPHSIDIVDLSGTLVHRWNLDNTIKVTGLICADHSDHILVSFTIRSRRTDHLGIFDGSSGKFRQLATIPGQSGDITWSPDEKTVFFTAEYPDNRPIFRLDISSGRIEEIDGPGFHDFAEVTPDSRELLFCRFDTGPQSWYRYWIEKRKTDLLYKPASPVLPEIPGRLVWISSLDQFKVPLIEYRSPNPLSPPAAIIEVHGGRHIARSVREWRPLDQIALRQGIDSLGINYRGSIGYGRAFFDAGNITTETDDTLAAIEYAHNVLHVPYRRIALIGHSDGAAIAVAAARRASSHVGLLFVLGLKYLDESMFTFPITGVPQRIVLVHFKHDVDSMTESRELLQRALGSPVTTDSEYHEYEFDDEHNYVLPNTEAGFSEILIDMLKHP